MRSLVKLALGSLLGVSLVLSGASSAAQAKDNCLLILCVDAPIVGPVVGTLGNTLEEVLSPAKPASPAPPVQEPPSPPAAPAQPPAAPAQPPAAPAVPAAPQSPVSNPPSGTPAESGDAAVVSPAPTPVPSPSAVPSPTTRPSPTPSPPRHTIRLVPDPQREGPHIFAHVGVLTPFVVGSLLVLLTVLSATSFKRYFRDRAGRRAD